MTTERTPRRRRVAPFKTMMTTWIAFVFLLYLCWNYHRFHSSLIDDSSTSRSLEVYEGSTAVSASVKSAGETDEAKPRKNVDYNDFHNYNKTSSTLFYENHYHQMVTLINQTTALDWDATNKTCNFGPFKRELGPHPYYYHYEVGDCDRHPTTAKDQKQLRKARTKNWRNQPLPIFNISQKYFVFEDLCQAAKTFQQYRRRRLANQNKAAASTTHTISSSHPHVSIVRLDENWGELSSRIMDKTAKWPGYYSRWVRSGCTSLEVIWDYINHPDTKAVVTTQFQNVLKEHYNPKNNQQQQNNVVPLQDKVISLPLGVKSWQNLDLLLKELKGKTKTSNNRNGDDRPQLLMINAQPRTMREKSIQTVIHKFQQEYGHTLTNTYSSKSYQRYLTELRQSKFILSPSGIGLDCYRHWEAMYMGTIPIIEKHAATASSQEDGWYSRTLADLPVALIDSYANLTPEWLQQEYQRIISLKADNYNYNKLTKQYWIKQIQSTLAL